MSAAPAVGTGPRIRVALDLGIYWGWMSIALFSTALTGGAGTDLIEATNLVSLTVSTLIVLVIAFLPQAAARSMAEHVSLRIATLIAGSVGTSLLLIAPTAPLAFAMGASLMGAAEGLLLYLFVGEAICVCQSAEEVVSLFSRALIIASVLYLAAMLAGKSAGVICAAIPLLALINLIKRPRSTTLLAPKASKDRLAWQIGKPAEPSLLAEIRRLPWKLLLGLAVFGIAFGLMRISASNAPVDVFQMSYLAHTLARAGTAIVALIVIGKMGKPYWVLSTFQLLAFTLGVCGYWLPLDAAPVLTVAATTAGYTCLELMLWAILFELYLETRIAFNTLYGIIRGLVSVATLGATAYALFVMSTMPSTAVHFVLLFFLLGMILVSSLLFGSRNVASLWGLERQTVESDGISSEEVVTHLVRHYGLTAREGEVVSLLMKGRNEPFISEALFISPSTTHSHVTHVYTKLSVHSRQELLNFIEQLLADNAVQK